MAVWVVLLLALLIGVVCGLRSFTGPAVVCWGAHLGWLNPEKSHLVIFTSVLALIVFTLLAIGELVADKTPKIPARITAVPLTARIVFGALCGAALTIAGGASVGMGLFLGALGALAGAYGGYNARRAVTTGGRLPDLPVALVEDLIAVGGGLFLVSRF
jgi:uncharacterized membrane protein